LSSSTGHQVNYRIRTYDWEPNRTIDVHATPEQIESLAKNGYMVRERLITGEHLEKLRAAADEIAAEAGGEQAAGSGGRFDGLFVRNLIDRHPAFLEMLKFAPTLSVARAVLGPQVQVHASVLRVSYPNDTKQQVEWHFHQRVIPDPVPPFFCRPQVLDNLIYLDDITLENGPLCVLPGTHLRDDDPVENEFGDKPGQVVLTVPAGSCVTAHASLWHRAMPTKPGSTIRRLFIFGYSPTWMKQVDQKRDGLIATILPNADEETRELLGIGGYL
jgi:ectoine hydroxylase-related dioxygenase (phytanoyl-CoA dioxygenase family)